MGRTSGRQTHFRQKSLIAFSERAVTLPWARSTGPDFPSSAAALDLNWPDDPKIGLFPPRDNFGLLVGSKDDTNELRVCTTIFDLRGISSQTFHYIKIVTKKIECNEKSLLIIPTFFRITII